MTLIENLLRNFFATGWMTATGWFLTFVGALIGFAPYGMYLRKFLHLPYFVACVLKLRLPGNFLDISYNHNDLSFYHQMDRRIYLLFGDFKKLGIINPKSRVIATVNQFEHRKNLEPTLDIDKMFNRRLDGIGDDIQRDEISQIFQLWNNYLIGEFNSELIEVVFVSILVRLGYKIPGKWKRKCYEIIRLNFMKAYNLTGKVEIQKIKDMLDAQGWLINPGKSDDNYLINFRNIYKIYNHNKRSFDTETLTSMIQKATQLFNAEIN
jgi:hypothetical protein